MNLLHEDMSLIVVVHICDEIFWGWSLKIYITTRKLYTMFLVGLHFDILITALILSNLVNEIAQKVFKFVLSGLSVMEFGFSLGMRLVNVLS